MRTKITTFVAALLTIGILAIPGAGAAEPVPQHHPELVGVHCVLLDSGVTAIEGTSASWLQDPANDGASRQPGSPSWREGA